MGDGRRGVAESKKREPDRYTSPKALMRAAQAWCLDNAPRVALGSAMGPGGLAKEMDGLREMAADTMGREISGRIREALHAGRAYVRALDRRRHEHLIATNRGDASRTPPETYYEREIRRVLDAVTRGGAWPPQGADSESTCRHLLIAWLDVRWSRPPLTHREMACLSILAGNGLDWANEHCRQARASGAKPDRPTVLALVRAEERAVALARTRFARQLEDTRAAARAFEAQRLSARK